MGGSSKQVTGYKHFANFLLFIGNPIEKLLGINFDKRGWINPLVDESGNALAVGTINKPSLYGENEGGVAGQIHARYGTANPDPVSFYANYLADNDLPSLAYPYQSYLAFTGLSYVEGSNPLELLSGNYGGGFYLGNSGYMKEMLLWPKRIHVRNDGSPQWYDEKAEIPEGGGSEQPPVTPETEPLGISGEYYMSRNLIVDGSPIEIVSPELGVINGKTLNFSGAGWSTSSLEDNPDSSFESRVTLGFARWIGTIRVKCRRNGVVQITGGTFSYTDSVGFDVYDIDFIGEVLHIFLSSPETTSIQWSYLYLQKFPAIEPKVNSGDINPIHKIREILTDDTAMNKPESDVNNENFMKAADRIWDEGLGISWAITEKFCIDAINELCSHIEAGIRINRQTGLYEMVLFRDDWFEENEIHVLAENKIKSISFEVQNTDDVVNQLNVSYYDRNNIKDASFSISENASIKNMSGRVNAESSDFPYFMNQRNAAIVAQWKLKQFTTPCWKGIFTTGFNEARKWNRYDIVKLNWSRKGIADLPVRIMSINLGDGEDNTVSIGFVEVVSFSDELTSTVVIDDKIDTAPLPPQPILFKAFELSYFEAVQAHGQRTVDDELAFNPDSGYVAVVAQRSQNNSLNAQMHTDAGTGYENSAVIQYCETAQLDQSLDRLASSFIVKKVGGLASVRIGSQIFINNEIMVFQGFDAASKLLTVKRGALDTIPQIHADDSVLFFADDFVAIDSAEYADSEVINVKALSTTPSGVLDLNAVAVQSVEIQSRAILPYPPANVKINGEYFPSEIETDLILTWMDRNRQQQTGGAILGWYEGGVTLESDVTYQLILIELDASAIELRSQIINLNTLNTYTFATPTMNANTRSIDITLKTVRNGYECMQAFNHTVELSTFFSAPYDIEFTVSDI